MRNLLLFTVLIISGAYADLSEQEKGYAVGAGIGATNMIKIQKYQKWNEKTAKDECLEVLKNDNFAQRSKEHSQIALDECVKGLVAQ